MILIAMALAAAADSNSAVAADQHMKFDCDTPGGSFSEIQLSLPQSARSVSGVLKMQEPRFSNKWVPAVTVAIIDADDKRTTIQLIAYTRESGLTLVLRNGKEAQTIGMIKGDQSLPFRFTFEQNGDWVIALSDYKKTISRHGDAVKLSLGCSSGNFDLSEMVISSTAK